MQRKITEYNNKFFLKRLFGVRVIGFDVNNEAVQWAKNHSVGNFIATDALNLTWIPAKTFDHFYSFAAVYYVPPNKVCSWGKEVVRILKPGGSALFGWLSGLYSKPFGKQSKHSWDCVGNLTGVQMTVEDDKYLFKSPKDLISNTGSFSVILKLK